MRATLKTLTPILLAAALGAGCSMNDQSTILPMSYVRDDWNNNVEMVEGAQQSAYQVNQGFVESGIVFHDYVQRDMGLSPGGVWYPTYEMAEGRVPTSDGSQPAMAQPDPAKKESVVKYSAPPPPAAKPMPAAKPAPAPMPPPQSGDGEVDYDMLQRNIKR